jgi:hypothetical protein
MRRIKLRKKRGQYRTIYVPNKNEKRILRRLLFEIDSVQWSKCAHHIVHGFMRGKNPVTNAEQHVGYKYTFTCDISDFFDSVAPSMVLKHFNGLQQTRIRKYCFPDARARQGLPTSPALSNLALCEIDREIERSWQKWDHEARYTRYADDMTVSFNRPPDEIRQAISTWTAPFANSSNASAFVTPSYIPIGWMHYKMAALLGEGFRLHPKKSHLLDARAGRRIITGVAVDDTGVYPTRKVRRKLRAAKHQRNTHSIEGLEEWCKLKRPQRYEHREALAVFDHAFDAFGDMW